MTIVAYTIIVGTEHQNNSFYTYFRQKTEGVGVRNTPISWKEA